jgi:23S rRNA-intervening sequence protein
MVQLFQSLGEIMQIRKFDDFEIWKEARRLTQEVYMLSKAPQFSKDYGLRDQMRRASVSIMSNIAGIRTRRKPRVYPIPLYCERIMRRVALPNLHSARSRIH